MEEVKIDSFKTLDMAVLRDQKMQKIVSKIRKRLKELGNNPFNSIDERFKIACEILAIRQAVDCTTTGFMASEHKNLTHILTKYD